MTLVEHHDTQIESLAEQPRISIVRRPDSFRGAKHEARRFVLLVGGAVVAGLLCGLTAISFLTERHASVQHWTRADVQDTVQTVVPVTYIQQELSPPTASTVPDSRTAEDLERIRIRNRRLEALVKVLRRRDANERGVPASSHKN